MVSFRNFEAEFKNCLVQTRRQGQPAASGARPAPANGTRSLDESCLQVSKLLVAESGNLPQIEFDMPMDLVSKAVARARQLFQQNVRSTGRRAVSTDRANEFALIFRNKTILFVLLMALQKDLEKDLNTRLETPGKFREMVENSYNGRMILSFSQAHFLDHKNGGVCHGITYHWIVGIVAQNLTPERSASLLTSSETGQVGTMVSQVANEHRTNQRKVLSPLPMNRYAADLVRAIWPQERTFTGRNAVSVSRKLTFSFPAGAATTIQASVGSVDSAHSIAFHAVDSAVYFLDPNVGLFQWDRQSFLENFPRFWSLIHKSVYSKWNYKHAFEVVHFARRNGDPRTPVPGEGFAPVFKTVG